MLTVTVSMPSNWLPKLATLQALDSSSTMFLVWADKLPHTLTHVLHVYTYGMRKKSEDRGGGSSSCEIRGELSTGLRWKVYWLQSKSNTNSPSLAKEDGEEGRGGRRKKKKRNFPFPGSEPRRKLGEEKTGKKLLKDEVKKKIEEQAWKAKPSAVRLLKLMKLNLLYMLISEACPGLSGL